MEFYEEKENKDMNKLNQKEVDNERFNKVYIPSEYKPKLDDETFKNARLKARSDLLMFLISAPITVASAVNGLLYLFIISGLISTYYFVKACIDGGKLNELKKCRLYLSMIEELEKPENSDILDVIEYERIYQIPLNFNTLDRYSYGDMKALKKELKRRNSKNNKEV